MKNLFLLVFITLPFIIFSCKKEPKNDFTNPNGDLIGYWVLVAVNNSFDSTVETTQAGNTVKYVTKRNYISTDNVGNLTIDAADMVGRGIGFNVRARNYTTTYQNGVETDSASSAYNITASGITNTAAFKRIAPDSVYFPGGAAFIGSSLPLSKPSGANINIDAGKLYFNNTEGSTSSSGGTTTTVKNVTTVVFQKV